jgi:hypothetical protein
MVRHFSHLLPVNCCSSAARHDILELARFLTELSVIDYFFVTRSPSSIALASLLNALDTTGTVSYHARLEFLENLKLLNGVSANTPEVEECRARLLDLYRQGGYTHAPPEDPVASNSRAETVSPVSVATHAFDCQYQGQSFAQQHSLISNC